MTDPYRSRIVGLIRPQYRNKIHMGDTKGRAKNAVAFLSWIKPYRSFWVVLFSIMVLDQFTKIWVARQIPFNTYHDPPPLPIIDGFFYLVHIGNRGSAWGLMSDYPFILIGIAIFALAFIFYMREQLILPHRVLQYSFGLLCGGIIGNLIDRLAHGYVVDFLDVHLPGYRWPAFNIADSSICIGIFMYVIFSYKYPTKCEGL